MHIYLQCCECGDVKSVGGCTPEVQLVEEDETKVYSSDNCGGTRASQLAGKFGATDAEHIALKLYDMFHGEESDPHYRGWQAYKHYDNDYVVDKFRHMGMMVQAMHKSWKFGGDSGD